jgi:hypothetical protein
LVANPPEDPQRAESAPVADDRFRASTSAKRATASAMKDSSGSPSEVPINAVARSQTIW